MKGRTNHHLFQLLLYQVATSVLTPGQIGSPIRGILSSQKNTTVILGEVTGVEKDQKCIVVRNADRAEVRLSYDYLILATGVTHSYFGHNESKRFAPGLKTLGMPWLSETRFCKRRRDWCHARKKGVGEPSTGGCRHRIMEHFGL